MMNKMGQCRSCCWLIVAALLFSCMALAVSAKGHGRRGRDIPVGEQYFNHIPVPIVNKHKLPKHFDWCDKNGKNLCTTSWNQHQPIYCGSCWAHGTLSMIQDRLKIKKKGMGEDTMLGRQTLLNCAALQGHGAGCDGGDPIDVFNYMKDFGLPDESCLSYNATDHTKFPGAKECPVGGLCRNCMPINDTDTCWAVPTPVLYYLTSFGKVAKGEDAMMSEIYHRGPITCSIATPDDFTYEYHNGIYKEKKKSTKEDIDHNVELVGWGTENGTPYWKVRNSWGTFWGEMGFFKLERGVNALRVEGDDCWYAEPEFKMEKDVRKGKLVGSMYGVHKPKQQDLVVS